MRTDPPPGWLYWGRVVHERRSPRHHFRYRVFSFLLDIERIGELASGLRCFSYNRFNLLSFHDRDHGPRDGAALRPWVETQLHAAGIAPPGGPIHLLCFPRMLGYVFNPLSIFYCADQTGAVRAVIYEVRNTFGDSHSYVIGIPGATRPSQTLTHRAPKRFHVSPFIAMEADYLFSLRLPGTSLSITICERQAGRDLLWASHVAHRSALTDRLLLAAFFRHPLMTAKVIAAIHWQAIRLLAKGVAFHRRPHPPVQSTTVCATIADDPISGVRS